MDGLRMVLEGVVPHINAVLDACAQLPRGEPSSCQAMSKRPIWASSISSGFRASGVPTRHCFSLMSRQGVGAHVPRPFSLGGREGLRPLEVAHPLRVVCR